MTNENLLTGGANKSESNNITIDDLAPNNYLTIVWSPYTENQTKVKTLSVDTEKAKEFYNQLNNVTGTTKNGVLYKLINNKYLNVTSVARYFAQTAFDSYGARQAVNGLINILQDGKIQNDNVLNAFLFYSGDILRDVAKKFNINDVNPLIQQLAGQNILNNFNGLDCFEHFCNATQDWTDKSEAELNEKAYATPFTNVVETSYKGILLGITESDTHSLEIEIPKKRVESGYNYTSHVIVNPFKKDLKLKITNKVIDSEGKINEVNEVNAIENTRDLIETIAKSKTRFDIYIRLSKEKFKTYQNVMFSSLSFDKNSSTGLTYDFSCTIEPVESYIPKTYIFTPPASTTNVKRNGSGVGNSNRTGDGKTNSSQNSNGNGNNNIIPASSKQARENAIKKLGLIDALTKRGCEAEEYAKATEMTVDFLKTSKDYKYKNIYYKYKNGKVNELNLLDERGSIQDIFNNYLKKIHNTNKGKINNKNK